MYLIVSFEDYYDDHHTHMGSFEDYYDDHHTHMGSFEDYQCQII